MCRSKEGNCYSKSQGEQQSYRDLGIGAFHFLVISGSYSRDRRESNLCFSPSGLFSLIGARVAHILTMVPTCFPLKTQDLAPKRLAENTVDSRYQLFLPTIRANVIYTCNQHNYVDILKIIRFRLCTHRDLGTTPIVSACRRGHLELIIWLVENGVESTNSTGNTPIMFALTAKQFDILKFLVGAISQAGGSVRVLQAVNHKNPGSATPLNLALETKQFDVAEWLIEAGADLFEVGAEQSAKWTVDNTEKAPQQICAPVCGRNIMHRMAGTGNLKAVEWLVASGARGQVATADSQGCTPMLLACQRGDLDMAKLLYHNGAKRSIETPDAGGTTPIQLACRMGHLHIVKWLQKKGAKEPHEILMIELGQGFKALEDSEQRDFYEQHGCVDHDNSHLDLFRYLQRDRLKCSSCQQVSDVKLRTCAGCQEVHYCSIACQRSHWKSDHSQTCIRNDCDY